MSGADDDCTTTGTVAEFVGPARVRAILVHIYAEGRDTCARFFFGAHLCGFLDGLWGALCSVLQISAVPFRVCRAPTTIAARLGPWHSLLVLRECAQFLCGGKRYLRTILVHTYTDRRDAGMQTYGYARYQCTGTRVCTISACANANNYIQPRHEAARIRTASVHNYAITQDIDAQPRGCARYRYARTRVSTRNFGLQPREYARHRFTATRAHAIYRFAAMRLRIISLCANANKYT